MGRAASAQSGQRTSLLISHVLQTTAADQEWGIRRDAPQGSGIAKLVVWFDNRKKAFSHEPRQASAVAVSVYQDDLTVIVIGSAAAQEVEANVQRLLVETYGIQLSQKAEANMPFGQ